MIDQQTHPYFARCGEWCGWFTNAGVAFDTCRWIAMHFDHGGLRYKWQDWVIVYREHVVLSGTGPREDAQRMAG